jgi:alanine dehydrogenase
MSVNQTLLLDAQDVAEHAAVEEVVPAVEESFTAYERNDAQMPAKSYVDLPEYGGDFRSMPAYLDAGTWDAAGIKWVNVHPNNPGEHDLPTVMGTMVYSDPETGFPLAIMDGTELTMQRTGAAAAVATDHLAVEDATTLGLVGAGTQAYTQLESIASVRPIETVVVSDVDSVAVDAFIDTFEDQFDVRSGTISEAGHCDILSTVTPVNDPIVSRGDVGEHTHINAMGADAEEKQELEAEILLEATLVIDDFDQCSHSGEINVPYADGALTDADIHASLGEVVVGTSDGRTTDDGITLFDSTGLAIQDVATARVVYERARSAADGRTVSLLSGE